MGEQQRLGDRRRVGCAHGVVDQLERLTLTQLAHVPDQLAHCLEQRLGTFEVRWLASDHDRQGAVRRSR